MDQFEKEPAPATNPSQRGEAMVDRGYGACSSSGCNCQAYGGSGDTCSNCGHNYQTHW
jgi:hypothetical protein